MSKMQSISLKIFSIATMSLKLIYSSVIFLLVYFGNVPIAKIFYHEIPLLSKTLILMAILSSLLCLWFYRSSFKTKKVQKSFKLFIKMYYPTTKPETLSKDKVFNFFMLKTIGGSLLAEILGQLGLIFFLVHMFNKGFDLSYGIIIITAYLFLTSIVLGSLFFPTQKKFETIKQNLEEL